MLQKIIKLTWPEFLELLTLLRLDVYFALFMFGFMLPGVSTSQFVQDKFCLNELKLDLNLCLNLESLGPEYENAKNQVYSSATTFRYYCSLISTPPGIILSLFMGYWIDSYPSHLKYLLTLPCLGGCLSAALTIYNSYYFEMDIMQLLWTAVISGVCGGFFIVMTGCYTYITRRTPAKYRAARFAILELFMFISMPLATAIGGKILTLEPWFPGQPRNYLGVFLIGFTCKILAMIWILLFLNDAGDPPVEEITESTTDKPTSVKQSCDNNNGPDKMVEIELETVEDKLANKSRNQSAKENMKTDNDKSVEKPTGCLPIVLDIFNPSTVITMFKVCCRRRENNGRAILWNLLMTMDIILIGHLGEHIVGFPFAQKVYHWDAAYYSYIHSVLMIIPSLANTLLPIILIHKFHLDDATLAVVGSISLLAALIIKGGFLEPWAYFLSVFAGICSGLLPVAIRSIISRIISQNEVGQVFALLACIESSGPMISSFVYATLFKLTIEHYPGMVHHAVAFTMFYPLLVILWLDLTKHKWDPNVIKKIKETQEKEAKAKQEKRINLNGTDNINVSSNIDSVANNSSNTEIKN